MSTEKTEKLENPLVLEFRKYRRKKKEEKKRDKGQYTLDTPQGYKEYLLGMAQDPELKPPEQLAAAKELARQCGFVHEKAVEIERMSTVELMAEVDAVMTSIVDRYLIGQEPPPYKRKPGRKRVKPKKPKRPRGRPRKNPAGAEPGCEGPSP